MMQTNHVLQIKTHGTLDDVYSKIRVTVDLRLNSERVLFDITRSTTKSYPN